MDPAISVADATPVIALSPASASSIIPTSFPADIPQPPLSDFLSPSSMPHVPSTGVEPDRHPQTTPSSRQPAKPRERKKEKEPAPRKPDDSRALHPVANILGHSLLAGLQLGPVPSDGSSGSSSSSSNNASKIKSKTTKKSAAPLLVPLAPESDSDSDIVSVDSQDPDAVSAEAESTRLRLAKLARKRSLSGTSGVGASEHDGYDSTASNAPDEFPDEMEPALRVRTARISRGNKVNVRVDGGWMKHPGNEERMGYALILAHAADGCKTASTPSDPGPLAPEIMKIIVEHGGDASGLPYNLCAQYKKTIVESAMARAALQPSHPSTQYRKKNKKAGEAEKEIGYGQGLQHPADSIHAFQGAPVIAHLPLECGGVRLAVIAPPAVPTSLHPICSAGRICAYCLEPLKGAPTHTGQSVHVSKRAKPSKEVAVAESHGYGEVPVRREFGAVSYYVHPHCTRAMEERTVSISSSSSLSLRMTPGPLYEYSEPDCSDATCDLCSRQGGCLQSVGISGIVTKPPGTEGWLAHPSCMHWLAHSRVLEPLAPETSTTAVPDEADEEEEKEHSLVKVNEEVVVTVRKAPASPALPAQPTRFDTMLNQWRCGLCSRHTGIVIRCAAASCAVRCHPLCVTLAGGSWSLCSFHLRDANGVENTESSGQLTLGFLCMTHSNNSQLYM